jgi:hypothetical protein
MRIITSSLLYPSGMQSGEGRLVRVEVGHLVLAAGYYPHPPTLTYIAPARRYRRGLQVRLGPFMVGWGWGLLPPPARP